MRHLRPEPLPKSLEFPPAARSRASRGHLLLLDPRHSSTSAAGQEHAATGALAAEGHTVTMLATGKEALAHVRRGDTDLMLADSTLPDLAFGDLLDRVHRVDPDLPVVIMTDSGD